jgi:hypothetical protein
MKALTLPDGQDSISVNPSNGSAAVVLQAKEVGGGAGNVEFVEFSLGLPALSPNQFNNQNGIDLSGLFSSDVQPGDFLWVNALYISSPVAVFAAAIECTSTNVGAIAFVAFDTGSSAGPVTVRVGRVAA